MNATVDGTFVRRHQVALFFAASIALMSILAYLAHASENQGIVLPGVVAPALIALLLVSLLEGKAGRRHLLSQLLVWRVGMRWWLVALLLIPVIAVVSLVLLGEDRVPTWHSFVPRLVILLILMTGEEVGWRGYALPRLQERMSALWAGLLVGLGWAIWHVPGFLIGTGVPLDTPFSLILVWILGASILLAWLYNNTKSVLLCVVFHVVANLTFSVLPFLPEVTGNLQAFSVFTALVWVVAVLVVARFGSATLAGKRA
jgi:membrane protease YdiL (CAAX protease family)